MTPWQIAIELRAAAAEECAEQQRELDDEFTRSLRKALSAHQALELARSRRFARGLVVALFVSAALNWWQLWACVSK